MSGGLPDREAIETAGRLTEALKGIGKELSRLNAYGRRNRHMIWVTIASIILDVTLTVLLVFVYGQVRNSSVEAAAAKQSNVALCLSGNKARAQQVELWEFLLHLGKPPKTPAQKRVITLFEDKLHSIFKPRNCSHINPGRP